MAFLLGSMRWLLAPLFCLLVALAAQPAAAGTVKVGVLKFGTVNWELDVIKANGLDRAEGLDIQTVDLANTGATTVALEGAAPLAALGGTLVLVRRRRQG